MPFEKKFESGTTHKTVRVPNDILAQLEQLELNLQDALSIFVKYFQITDHNLFAVTQELLKSSKDQYVEDNFDTILEQIVDQWAEEEEIPKDLFSLKLLLDAQILDWKHNSQFSNRT